jgi:hypothetical protein
MNEIRLDAEWRQDLHPNDPKAMRYALDSILRRAKAALADAQPRGEGALLSCVHGRGYGWLCPVCQPAPPASGAPCRECFGVGARWIASGGARTYDTCPACAGSGKHGTGGACACACAVHPSGKCDCECRRHPRQEA